MSEEGRVPESEDDTRGELRLPVRLGGEDGVHEGEETGGVVIGLDVNVEHDVFVLGLKEREQGRLWGY